MLTVYCSLLLAGCSKEEIQDDPEVIVKQEEKAQPCELPAPNAGCETVFLQGERGWVKIVDPGETEDPYFLYSSQQKEEPRGTVTVYRDGNKLLIRFNDTRVESILVKVSQQITGFGSNCKLKIDIRPPSSDNDPDATIIISDVVQYPFYLKISANVCS